MKLFKKYKSTKDDAGVITLEEVEVEKTVDEKVADAVTEAMKGVTAGLTKVVTDAISSLQEGDTKDKYKGMSDEEKAKAIEDEEKEKTEKEAKDAVGKRVTDAAAALVVAEKAVTDAEASGVEKEVTDAEEALKTAEKEVIDAGEEEDDLDKENREMEMIDADKELVGDSIGKLEETIANLPQGKARDSLVGTIKSMKDAVNGYRVTDNLGKKILKTKDSTIGDKKTVRTVDANEMANLIVGKKA